ncbi:hypothetical protein J3458_001673 [Metarhizium acridum]|uniref:uncharacterized protein n=1 Tax=Metarhizium acridum TaxID=92637 RepID=UPI001C6C1612|nr:hypothetical protein J3458_001673 [Metarhizium acridum]
MKSKSLGWELLRLRGSKVIPGIKNHVLKKLADWSSASKVEDGTGYEVFIASVERGVVAQFSLPSGQGHVRLLKGDHSSDLQLDCSELNEASKYAAKELQRDILSAYIASFQTGSLDMYRMSQRPRVRDRAPRVENIFGFVEPYRDPQGIRADFEAPVAIADDSESRLFAGLVDNSAKFIRRLPWATPENDDKGPLERSLFEPPDFSSIHGSQAKQYPFIEAAEAEQLQKHKLQAYYWWVVLHELLGHGTGRMTVESMGGKFNFDGENPPVNPITRRPISSWYKPGQTWTGQFGQLATTLDECRAEPVGAYLMDDSELLEMLGFTETSDIHAEDC